MHFAGPPPQAPPDQQAVAAAVTRISEGMASLYLQIGRDAAAAVVMNTLKILLDHESAPPPAPGPTTAA
jgi:hypothetical protein